MTLTIIICTNNRYALLEKAVASALAQTYPRTNILVVDNSPDKKRAEAFADRYAHLPHVRFVFDDIQNLSHARNVGISLAESDIVAFLDDDAVAESYWATALVGVFAAGAGSVGCVGGPVRPIWPGLAPTWLTPFLATYLSILDLGDTQRELCPGEWLAGCNIAFDRLALLEVGGFRQELGRTGNQFSLMSNEEGAAWQSLKKRGMKIVYAPKAIVSHHIKEERLSSQWLSRRVIWQGVSDVISDPEYSKYVTGAGTTFAILRALLIIALRRLPGRRRRPLTDGEALYLHRFVSILLCRGID